VKFCTRVDLLSGQVFSPFGEHCLRGVTGAALLPGRAVGIDVGGVASGDYQRLRHNHPPAPGARVGGPSEFRATMLLKAVWLAMRLASRLTHLF